MAGSLSACRTPRARGNTAPQPAAEQPAEMGEMSDARIGAGEAEDKLDDSIAEHEEACRDADEGQEDDADDAARKYSA